MVFWKKGWGGNIQSPPEVLISVMLICLIKVKDLKIMKCLKQHLYKENWFLSSYFSYSNFGANIKILVINSLAFEKRIKEKGRMHKNVLQWGECICVPARCSA